MGYGIRNGIMQDLRNENSARIAESDIIAKEVVIATSTGASETNPVFVELYCVIIKPFYGADGKFNLIERTGIGEDTVDRLLSTKDGFLFGVNNYLHKVDIVPRQYVLDFAPFTTADNAIFPDGKIANDASIVSDLAGAAVLDVVDKAVVGFGIPDGVTITEMTDEKTLGLSEVTTETQPDGVPFIILGAIPAQPGVGMYRVKLS